MNYLFSPEDRRKAFAARKRLLIFWFALLAVYVALVGTLIGVDIYIVNVFRDRGPQVWMTVVSVLATTLFGCFSLFFFSIKFRLTRKYCKMLRDMERGLKDETEGTFLSYDMAESFKDGVIFYGMELDCKPLRRGDITYRKVLVEHTIPKIDLNPGDKLRFITHANILMAYEIIYRAPVIEKTAEEEGGETAEVKADTEVQVSDESTNEQTNKPTND